MIIDMEKAPKEVFEHFKGGEKALSATMYFDGNNRILYGVLEPGASIGLHKHEGNCEMIYVLEGRAKAVYDDTVEYVEAGQCHYCPEGHTHSLINESDSTVRFIGFVPKQ